MILALDPGTESAGEVAEGGRIPVGNTLPDVNPDEVLASLDGDTRAYLRILLNAGGTAFRDDEPERRASRPPSQDLRETFKRFEPTARDGEKFTKRPDQAAPEHPPRDPQLPGAVHRARREGQAAGRLRGLLQRELRGVRPGGGQPARGAPALPGGALPDRHHAPAHELAGQGARPDARGAAPVRARAGARRCAASSRSCATPRRSSATRSGRSRATCSPRCGPAHRHQRPRAGHAGPHALVQGAQQLLQHAGVRPARRHPVLPLLERLGRALGHHAHEPPGRARPDAARNRAGLLHPVRRARHRSSRATRSWACSPSSRTSPTTARAARPT